TSTPRCNGRGHECASSLEAPAASSRRAVHAPRRCDAADASTPVERRSVSQARPPHHRLGTVRKWRSDVPRGTDRHSGGGHVDVGQHERRSLTMATVFKRARTSGFVVDADGKPKLNKKGKPIRKRTSAPPRFYARIRQLDGTFKKVNTHQPTRDTALAWALEEEGRIARGEAPAKVWRAFGELAAEWERTLTNRSAADDRSRLRRHLLPTFAKMRVDEIAVAAIMQWVVKMRSPTPAEK